MTYLPYTLVGPTVARLVQDSLAVKLLNNWLFILEILLLKRWWEMLNEIMEIGKRNVQLLGQRWNEKVEIENVIN